MHLDLSLNTFSFKTKGNETHTLVELPNIAGNKSILNVFLIALSNESKDFWQPIPSNWEFTLFPALRGL